MEQSEFIKLIDLFPSFSMLNFPSASLKNRGGRLKNMSEPPSPRILPRIDTVIIIMSNITLS
jgi:hypothetical protein